MGGLRLSGLIVGLPGPPWSMFDADGSKLFIMNAGNLVQLSPVSIYDLQVNPIISPDGQNVAFRDYVGVDASSGIYVVPVDGAAAAGPLDPTYLMWTDGFGYPAQSPSWRPDGGAILFTSSAPEGSYTGTTNGGKIMRVTYPGGVATTLWIPDIQSPIQREEGWRPIYSPDATKIAFFVNIVAGGGGTFSRQGLWVMDADGTNVVHLDNWDASGDGTGYRYDGTQAVWSPDSQWLAYIDAGSGGGAGCTESLYKINVDGTGKALLRSNPDPGSPGCRLGWGGWADDASHILYTAYFGGGDAYRRIRRINPDGTNDATVVDATNGTYSGQNYQSAWRLRDRIYWFRDINPIIFHSCALDGTDIQTYYDGTADGTIVSAGIEWD